MTKRKYVSLVHKIFIGSKSTRAWEQKCKVLWRWTWFEIRVCVYSVDWSLEKKLLLRVGGGGDHPKLIYPLLLNDAWRDDGELPILVFFSRPNSCQIGTYINLTESSITLRHRLQFYGRKEKKSFFFVQVAYLWHIRGRKSSYYAPNMAAQFIIVCDKVEWQFHSDKIPPTQNWDFHQFKTPGFWLNSIFQSNYWSENRLTDSQIMQSKSTKKNCRFPCTHIWWMWHK